jgi:hypothetical protein
LVLSSFVFLGEAVGSISMPAEQSNVANITAAIKYGPYMFYN